MDEAYLPLRRGFYRTRNGRVAVVVRVDPAAAGGYLEPEEQAQRAAVTWDAATGKASGTRACWDITGWRPHK